MTWLTTQDPLSADQKPLRANEKATPGTPPGDTWLEKLERLCG